LDEINRFSSMAGQRKTGQRDQGPKNPCLGQHIGAYQ
jgi:hypothetical protein